MHAGDQVTPIGRLDTATNIAKVHAARAALDAAIDAGYFVRECVTTFEFRYHFDSVDAWLEHMANRWAAAGIDPASIARARELLEGTTGELLIREQVRAARLRACVSRRASSPPP